MENNMFCALNNSASTTQPRNIVSLRNQGYQWLVSIVDGVSLPASFSTVDSACDYMIDSLLVPEDEIDVALVHLHNNKHIRALFVDNKFERTAAE
jgi:hypothetical protein